MRAIFDLIKEAGIALDGLWIDSGGHEIHVVDKNLRETPVHYGFYDMPKQTNNMFGIDAPDEMEVQINRNVFLKNTSHFTLGTHLQIADQKWIITHRTWVYNRFLGKYRMALTCQMYAKSVTVGMNDVPCCDNSILDDEE